MNYKALRLEALAMKYRQETVGDEEARKHDQTSRESEEGKSCVLREGFISVGTETSRRFEQRVV